MIRYALKCENDHQFESWFQSADAFETLRDSGHIACAICGSGAVSLALMAPGITKGTPAPARPLDQPANETDAALAKLRKDVETNSDYVGMEFANEARAMHDGTAPERAIYGEAKPEEAKKLIEEGIPVAPLPFMPKRKTN